MEKGGPTFSLMKNQRYVLDIELKKKAYSVQVNGTFLRGSFFWDKPELATHILLRGRTSLKQFQLYTPKAKLTLPIPEPRSYIIDELTSSEMKWATGFSGKLPRPLRTGDELVIKGILLERGTNFQIVFDSAVLALRISIDYYKKANQEAVFTKIKLFLEEVYNRNSVRNLKTENINFTLKRAQNDYKLSVHVGFNTMISLHEDDFLIADYESGINIEDLEDITIVGGTIITECSIYSTNPVDATTLENVKMPFNFTLMHPLLVRDEISVYGRPTVESGQFILTLGKDCGNNECDLELLRIEVVFNSDEKKSILLASHQLLKNKPLRTNYYDPLRNMKVSFQRNQPFKIGIHMAPQGYAILVGDSLVHGSFYYDDLSLATHFIVKGDTTLDKFVLINPKVRLTIHPKLPGKLPGEPSEMC
jgi:hypothetical protein